MAREDITFADIFKAIWRQANEDEVEGVFRLHILRFWSRERTIKFCLHLLGDEAQEWWASREAVEQSVEPTPCPHCATRDNNHPVWCPNNNY